MSKPQNSPCLNWTFRLTAPAFALLAASCGAVEDLAAEETTGTIVVPDFNASDFEVPEIVAPDIDIDITEAPEIPDIRFPDAVEITFPEISSSEIAVAETEDETIFTIEGQVLFDFDNAELRSEALTALDEILAAIQNQGFEGTVEVAGHTDSVGTAEYNQDLSVRRSTGVALWFKERLPEGQDVQAVGYGESQPIARNTNDDGSDDETGQTQNRRVEIIVSK